MYTLDLIHIRTQHNNIDHVIEMCRRKKEEIQQLVVMKVAFFTGQMLAINEFMETHRAQDVEKPAKESKEDE